MTNFERLMSRFDVSGTDIGLFVLIGLGILICLLFAVWAFAYAGIMFTFCKEGHMVFVLEGGNVTKMIARPPKTHTYDKRNGEIFEKTSPGVNKSNEAWNLFGIYLVGLPFLCTVFKRKQHDRDGSLCKELATQFPFRKTHTFVIKDAETKELYPVTVNFEATTDTTNGITRYVIAPDWREQVNASATSAGRGWIAEHSVEDLLKSQETPTAGSLVLEIKDCGNTSAGSNEKTLGELAGTKIVAVNLGIVDLGEYAEQLASRGLAEIKVGVAKAQADAALEVARGEAGAFEKMAAAQRNNMKLIKELLGDDAKALANYLAQQLASEALQNVTTFAPGNPSTFLELNPENKPK